MLQYVRSKSMKYQRITKVAASLSICIVVVVVIMHVFTDRHDLLQRSRKVAVITDWDEFHPEINPLAFHYNWLSDDSILFAREHQQREKTERRYFRRNIANNNEEEIYPLFTLMRDVDDRCGILLSPDGSAFVARGRISDSDLVNWRSKQKNALPPEAGAWVWLRDGHHLALLTTSENQSSFSEAVLRDMASPSKTKRIPLKSNIPFNENAECADCGDHFSIFVHGDYNTQDKTADVYETGLGIEPYKEHKLSLHLPNDAELFECHLSPTGDKIAFFLSVEQAPTWAKLLGRFFPANSRIKRTRMELWVSDLKGEMYNLGEIEYSLTSHESQRPYSIKWQPDGKHISYIYRNAIWIIPIVSNRYKN